MQLCIDCKHCGVHHLPSWEDDGKPEYPHVTCHAKWYNFVWGRETSQHLTCFFLRGLEENCSRFQPKDDKQE